MPKRLRLAQGQQGRRAPPECSLPDRLLPSGCLGPVRTVGGDNVAGSASDCEVIVLPGHGQQTCPASAARRAEPLQLPGMASSKQPPALEQASVQILQEPLESLQTFQQQTLDNINMVQSKIREILKAEDVMTSAVCESEGLNAILEFFQTECFRLREINTKLQKEIAELTKGDSSPEQNHEQPESEKNK